eukprot:Selendium_serpulae@DN6489_c0_g1_i2.p1
MSTSVSRSPSAAGARQADAWLEQIRRDPPEILTEADLMLVCERVKEILIEENNVQPVDAPVVICGDIHGQFYDLMELFDIGGNPRETNYVFLGDYVDRGHNSVETFQYLLLLKIRYPANITLIRGNHESRQITQVYGFYDECIRKYGNANSWKFSTDIFDYLTLAAVIDNRVFCVHGGLSPEVKLVDQLRLFSRVQEIPHDGPFGDMVWSDPSEAVECWDINPRGAGYLFGAKVAKEFNHINDLDMIARAHQLAMEGYRYMFADSLTSPTTYPLVTVWSAPNYCYRCGNVAAIMRIGEDLQRTFLIFKDTEASRRPLSPRLTVPYFL